MLVQTVGSAPALGPAASGRASPPAAPVAAQAAPAQANAPPLDPFLRVDAALNMVVIEFHSPDGELTNSIPSPREIRAYRTAGGEAPAPAPALNVKG